ncbi:ESX secretion-associated protein EspG [Saccharomonospora azurea]|uniref:ESX secretion-associated protein EspG n=1 Tax=Saccharomonospora azurea TaxID=40988 RepID=UPI003D9197B4
MSETFEFTLGSVEADIVGQALGVNVRRFPLKLRNTTTDPARRRRLAILVAEQLVERGLATSTVLHPAVRTAFGLFADHRVSGSISGVDGFGDDIAVLVLTDGAQALGVTQNAKSDDLLFSLFSDDEIVDVLTGVLPEMPPVAGSEVVLRARADAPATAWDARKAAERAEDEEETDAFGNLQVAGRVDVPRGARRGFRAGDEDRLRQAMAGRRLGGGAIEVSGRGGAVSRSWGWLDTEEGRYLVLSEREQDEQVITYRPAGRADVAGAFRDGLARAY